MLLLLLLWSVETPPTSPPRASTPEKEAADFLTATLHTENEKACASKQPQEGTQQLRKKKNIFLALAYNERRRGMFGSRYRHAKDKNTGHGLLPLPHEVGTREKNERRRIGERSCPETIHFLALSSSDRQETTRGGGCSQTKMTSSRKQMTTSGWLGPRKTRSRQEKLVVVVNFAMRRTKSDPRIISKQDRYRSSS
jgi:hypothetical protein